jgi:hypothetical protein
MAKGKKYKDAKMSPLEYRRNKISNRQQLAVRRKE